MISAAMPSPTTRGSDQETPTSPADRPIRTNAALNVAAGEARRISAHSAKPSPPPAAGPLTAAITGCGSSWNLANAPPQRCWPSIISCGLMSGSVSASSRSRPEQKPRPAPVITSTRASVSAVSASQKSCISSNISNVIAFRRSGRLSVITTMPSRDRSTVNVL